MPRAAGRRAVEIRNPQGKRLYAALEIGADGGGENAELVFVGGLYAQHAARGKHKRPQIERRAAAGASVKVTFSDKGKEKTVSMQL